MLSLEPRQHLRDQGPELGFGVAYKRHRDLEQDVVLEHERPEYGTEERLVAQAGYGPGLHHRVERHAFLLD